MARANLKGPKGGRSGPAYVERKKGAEHVRRDPRFTDKRRSPVGSIETDQFAGRVVGDDQLKSDISATRVTRDQFGEARIPKIAIGVGTYGNLSGSRLSDVFFSHIGGTINGTQIADSTVNNRMVQPSSIHINNKTQGSLPGSRIANLSINGAAKLEANSVFTGQINMTNLINTLDTHYVRK